MMFAEIMGSMDGEELMMRLPLQITFRQMQPSLALEARIRELATRLAQHSDAARNGEVVRRTT
jgi:hypothetical protein